MENKTYVRYGVAGLAILWALVGLGFGWIEPKAALPTIVAAVSALFSEKDYLKAQK